MESNDRKQDGNVLPSSITFCRILWTVFKICAGSSQRIISCGMKCMRMCMFPRFGQFLIVQNFCLTCHQFSKHYAFCCCIFHKWMGEIIRYYNFFVLKKPVRTYCSTECTNIEHQVVSQGVCNQNYGPWDD